MTIVRERQIEMTWRCSTCATVNRGRDMTCSSCGDPKDASEHYEMPTDTARAPTVTDPELVVRAKAGPNWRCSYCSSDQRRTDGTCRQCGGVPAAPRRPSAAAPVSSPPRRSVVRGPIAAVVGGVVLVGGATAFATRTRTYEAEVTAVFWEQRIVVDRYDVQEREGWRRETGADAFDIVSLGQQIHHYDEVLDHYDTERYTVDVPCGQDCQTIPETCSESCSANGNGFATCRTTCSGGGQSCTTRYCDQWRTRQVPRYRDEPRYAERIRYKIWDWAYARTVVASGSAVDDVHWPDGGAMPEADAEGHRERETRESSFKVALAYDDASVVVAVAADDFASFAPGSSHVLVTHWGSFELDGLPVEQAKE